MVKPKSVSVDDLIELAPNGSNYAAWRQRLSEYFAHENGYIGRFLVPKADGTFDYVPRPPLRTPLEWAPEFALIAGITDADKRKMQIDELTSRHRDEAEDLVTYHEWYATVLQTLPLICKEKLERSTNWPAVQAAGKPLGLIDLVKTEILLDHDGLAKSAQEDMLLRQWQQCVQQKWSESIDDYVRRCKFVWDCMVSANHPLRGTKEAAIRAICHGLDPKRYGAWMAHTANEENGGAANAYPAEMGLIPTSVGRYVSESAPAAMASSSQRAPAQHYIFACSVHHTDDHTDEECFAQHPELRDYVDSKPSALEATKSTVRQREQRSKSDKGASSGDYKGKAKGKPKSRKPRPITAYSTDVVPADSAADSNSLNSLWGFTAYTLVVSYSARLERRHPRLVTIDTFASHSFAADRSLMRALRPYEFKVQGATGLGSGSLMGTLPGFRDCAYLPQAECNGLCVRDAYMYPNETEHGVSWTIHLTPDFSLVFLWDDETGHYSLIFDDDLLAAIDAALSSGTTLRALKATVAQNERDHPPSDVKAAREARQLQERLYFPADGAMVKTLTGGSFTNCKVTPRAVKVARDIFGLAEPILAGKTRKKQAVASHEIPVVAHMERDQTVYMDVFYWRSEAFILAIAKPLYLVCCRHVDASLMNSEAIAEEIEAIRSLIESRGYVVVKIVVDPDKKLAKLEGLVLRLTVVGSGSHVADIEVEIRVVKERVRCMDASLTVPVPRRLIKFEVYGAVACRNMILRGWQTVSSRESFTQVKTDIKRDCRAKFMDHIMAKRDPVLDDGKGEEPRMVSALYMGSTGNAQGTVFAYDLTTEAHFRCDHFTITPMSELVVQKIFELWTRDEPVTQRKRRAAWKLYHRGRDGRGPVLPPPEGDIDGGDIARLPENLAPHPVPLYHDRPNEVEQPHEQDGAPRGIDHPAGSVALPSAETERDQYLGAGPEDHVARVDGDDDFRVDAASDEDLHAQEDDASLRLDPDAPLGTETTAGGLKRSARIASRRVDAYTLRAYRTSLRKALAERHKGGKEAVMRELRQLIDKDVWAYIKQADLSITQLKKAIRCHMFLKEKLDAAGNFVKMKARLVAGGDGQDKTIYQNISSPTVCLESVFGMLAVAAILRRKVATVDITGAYLECELPEDDEVIMLVDPLLSRLLAEVDPSAVPFQNDKGQLCVRLKRALYGCVQSARLWLEKLRDTLVSLGFEANPYDLCTFNKVVDGEQISIAFHVDDLLITCCSDSAIDALIVQLEGVFTGVSATRGATHSYLGMQFIVKDGGIELDMSGYLEKILADRPELKNKPTPADTNLMSDLELSQELNDAEQKLFHSEVAKVLFIAKRCRMQCLTAVSVLASRVKCATRRDRDRLDRIFHYLHTTRDMVMCFKCGGVVEFAAYVDASWAVHDDCHGRTGIVLIMAGCAIGAWSYKQKMVTLSSTESEIVALADAMKEILWFRNWLLAQGHALGPTVVYEDNEALLKLMRAERGTHQRTRHLSARLFHARDLDLDETIVLQYMPTEDMIADLMTKPLQGALFTKLTARLMGIESATGHDSSSI